MTRLRPLPSHAIGELAEPASATTASLCLPSGRGLDREGRRARRR